MNDKGDKKNKPALMMPWQLQQESNWTYKTELLRIDYSVHPFSSFTHTHARIGKYKKRNETTIQAKVEETTTHLQSRLQTSIQRKANVKYHESNHFLLIVHRLCGRSLSFLDTNDCLNFQDWLLEERKIVVIVLSLFWTKRKLMGKISLLVFLALNRAMWFFTIVLFW